MDPELDSAQNPKPAASGSSSGAVPVGEQAPVSEPEGQSSANNEAMDLTAEKVLAKELAITAADKGLKAQSKTYKHPMAIDLLLAVGLLFAMAGLTVSFVKTYITHSAKTSILQGNYKAAIGILHGSPIPEFFGGAGTDNSEDLLNQALYLDAMEKLDNNRDDQTALQELAKVSQGSFYYELAQDQFRKLEMLQHDVDSQPQGSQPGTSQPTTQSPPQSPPPEPNDKTGKGAPKASEPNPAAGSEKAPVKQP